MKEAFKITETEPFNTNKGGIKFDGTLNPFAFIYAIKDYHLCLYLKSVWL